MHQIFASDKDDAVEVAQSAAERADAQEGADDYLRNAHLVRLCRPMATR